MRFAVHAGVLLGVGYLFSWPSRAHEVTPGYAWLRGLAPDTYKQGDNDNGHNLWFALGALALVWARVVDAAGWRRERTRSTAARWSALRAYSATCSRRVGKEGWRRASERVFLLGRKA